MAHTKGRQGDLTIGGTGVGGITSLSLNRAHDEIDETDFDSGGYKERAYGETGLSISVTVLRDEADTAQDSLRAAVEGKTTVAAVYQPFVGSGSPQIAFTALVSAKDTSNERNADTTEAWTLVSTGTPTDDNQA